MIEQKKSRLPANVVWLSVASMLNDISGEIIARSLPLFMAGPLGLGYSVIGLIEGIADTTSSLLKIFSGWYSDRWGKRKTVAAIGYALTSVARPILYAANSWVLPLVSRFVDRAGKGIRTSPRDALIADSVAPEMRGRAFGFHRALDPLGAVIGALIAAYALYSIGSSIGVKPGEVQLSASMFRTLVIIATIPTFLSTAIVFVMVKEAKREIKSAPDLHGALSLFRIPDLRRFLIAVLVMGIGLSSDAFLILRAQSLGVSPIGIFVIIALLNVITTVSAYPAGILSDRLSRKTIIRAGWITYGLIYLGFAFATEPWHIWVLYIVYGLYYGLTEGSERALVADLVHSEKRGTAYGLYNGAVGLVVLPASIIAGVLWQHLGPQAPFLFGAAASLAGVLMLSSVRSGSRPG